MTTNKPEVARLVEALEAALKEIECIMQEAYNNAYSVCCGRPGEECCGSPEPEWSEQDQHLIDRLEPHRKALSDALSAHRKPSVASCCCDPGDCWGPCAEQAIANLEGDQK